MKNQTADETLLINEANSMTRTKLLEVLGLNAKDKTTKKEELVKQYVESKLPKAKPAKAEKAKPTPQLEPEVAEEEETAETETEEVVGAEEGQVYCGTTGEIFYVETVTDDTVEFTDVKTGEAESMELDEFNEMLEDGALVSQNLTEKQKEAYAWLKQHHRKGNPAPRKALETAQRKMFRKLSKYGIGIVKTERGLKGEDGLTELVGYMFQS